MSLPTEYASIDEIYDWGRRYALGDGVPQSLIQAAELLKKAADLGHVKAQYNLGVLYHEEQSYEKAFHYFSLASEKDHGRAHFMLGCYHANGWCSSASLEQAAHFFKLSAQHGIAEAQYNLSVCLQQGKGIEKSEIEAIHYLELAALQENADALYNLGICYLHGTGVPVSEQQAVRYFERAAKQTHSRALEALERILNA